MVNLSHYLLAQFRQDNPGSGIVDLKAYCRGFRYVREMLKMLPEQPDPILLSQIFASLPLLVVFTILLQPLNPRNLAKVLFNKYF